MYAVIKTGGKQYRVSPGEEIKVEKLGAEIGDLVNIQDVLLVVPDEGSPKVGQPTVAGATVQAKVVDHGRYDKIIVFKKKRRKGYKVKRGHRQQFTRLLIDSIQS